MGKAEKRLKLRPTMSVLARLAAAAILLVLSGGGSGCSGDLSASPDLVLLNGKVWTVDAAQPEVEALAVLADRIVAMGTTSEIEAMAGPETEVMDLEGKRVLPGFIDNHTHFVNGGFWLAGVRLKDAVDEEEFGRRLAARSEELPDGAWITGGTWDHDNWPGGELPTAELVDRFVPDRPVFVTRYDGHMSVANSLALRLAGVTGQTPDPAGGVIVRKAGSRQPAGVLKDTAQELVRRVMPDPTPEEVRQALQAALLHAREVGVTSLTHMGLTEKTLSMLQELRAEGRLTARIDARWPLARWDEVAAMKESGTLVVDDWLRTDGLKGYVDGSLGSSTALFFEPYVQDPTTRGVWVTEREVLKEQIRGADRADLHVAVHAIGDRANSELLSIYEEVIEENGPKDHRFRIEHAQHIAPEDFARFAALGVVASVQPFHAIDDGRWAIGRIGEDRCRTTYAFRTFRDHGVRMSFGSDWTVAPLNPILGIDAAVTRRTTDGKTPEGWFPEQKISVEEAIEAYTLGSAYATFSDSSRGSIRVGKLADLVVLSQDILNVAAEDIVKTEVLMTLVGGQQVYRAE